MSSSFFSGSGGRLVSSSSLDGGRTSFDIAVIISQYDNNNYTIIYFSVNFFGDPLSFQDPYILPPDNEAVTSACENKKKTSGGKSDRNKSDDGGTVDFQKSIEASVLVHYE